MPVARRTRRNAVLSVVGVIGTDEEAAEISSLEDIIYERPMYKSSTLLRLAGADALITDSTTKVDRYRCP